MGRGDSARVYTFTLERAARARSLGDKEFIVDFEDIVQGCEGVDRIDIAAVLTTKRKLTDATGLRLKHLVF